MRVVLLGAPGCGKGTQGKKLMDRLGIPQISTGDLLRAAVQAGTPLGRKAKAAMDAGELVADEVVIEMIHERLEAPDTGSGFILDGFPRTEPQAEALDRLLRKMKLPLDKAVHLDVDQEEIVKRLLARGRPDDTETVIRNRLAVYGNQTQPLLDYYRQQSILATVRGAGGVEEIFGRILAVLDSPGRRAG